MGWTLKCFMNLNEKVWIVVGIAFLVILSAYIYAYDLWGIRSVTDNISQKMEKKQAELTEKKNTLDCPEEIIPEKMVLFEAEGTAGNSESLSYRYKLKNDWKDGTAITYYLDEMGFFDAASKSLRPDCNKGNQQGENVNYLYCRNLVYEIEDTEIKKGGIVGETKNTEYKISLTLEPIENEEWFERSPRDENHVYIYGNYSVISSTCVKK